MTRAFYDPEHEAFRGFVREFVRREVEPKLDRWEEQRMIDRETWKAAGRQGLLGIRTLEELGGGMTDYRYRCLIQEEFARVGAAALASGISINEDIVASYLLSFGTSEQRAAWLPGMAEGSVVASIAMSEPSAGSDLRAMRTTAVRDGGDWVINGAKTFITSGYSCDVVLVAARTGEREGRPQLSLILVPAGTPGCRRWSAGRRKS